MINSDSIKSRLLSKVSIDPITGCWNWTGRKRAGGYGGVVIERKDWLTHRLSYELFNGEIPQGNVVCHKCDNPACVNPDHLFIGTQSDNMKDAYIKGRIQLPDGGNCQYKPGRKAHNRLLSDDQVSEIKKLIDKGVRPFEIAKIVNVKRHFVADIKRKQAYFNTD